MSPSPPPIDETERTVSPQGVQSTTPPGEPENPPPSPTHIITDPPRKDAMTIDEINEPRKRTAFVRTFSRANLIHCKQNPIVEQDDMEEHKDDKLTAEMKQAIIDEALVSAVCCTSFNTTTYIAGRLMAPTLFRLGSCKSLKAKSLLSRLSLLSI